MVWCGKFILEKKFTVIGPLYYVLLNHRIDYFKLCQTGPATLIPTI